MAKSITLADEVIISKIYLIREHKIMLDTDLAELYQVETRRLNEQVKRNIARFPKDFMFQLTEKKMGKLEVAKCDFKLGWSQKTTIRIY